MKGLLKYLSPFSPDQSGAVSVLFPLGGVIVIADAGGCTGNICGFDEPRWFETKSAIFSAGLRDMDAILGRDDRLVEKLKDACHYIDGNFAAIIGTPVPTVIATDLKALKRMASKKIGKPVLSINCTGTRLYDKGASDTYLELFKTFEMTSEIDKTGILGFIPLDISSLKMKKDNFVYYDSFQDFQTKVNKNIVVSPCGYKAAMYLKEQYDIPFELDYPFFPDSFLNTLQVENKKVLIIHQQVAAHVLRNLLYQKGAQQVDVGCWFMEIDALKQKSDQHYETEQDFIEQVYSNTYDVIIADLMLKRPLREFKGDFISFPHFALSGTFWEDFYENS